MVTWKLITWAIWTFACAQPLSFRGREAWGIPLYLAMSQLLTASKISSPRLDDYTSCTLHYYYCFYYINMFWWNHTGKCMYLPVVLLEAMFWNHPDTLAVRRISTHTKSATIHVLVLYWHNRRLECCNATSGASAGTDINPGINITRLPY